MKQYKIFENEVGRREAVKQGWSWPAFFFGFIWAFVKRQYVAGAIVLGGVIVVVLLSLKVDDLFAMGDKSARSLDHVCESARWVIMVLLGVNGNELREKNLFQRGYILRGVLAALSPSEALASHERAGREREKVHLPDESQTGV
jgi:hypothetical protein